MGKLLKIPTALSHLLDRFRRSGAILSADAIQEAREARQIVIDPFDPAQLSPNSYDIRIGETLLVYENGELDAYGDNPTHEITMPTEGYVIQPEEFYLAATAEYTESIGFVPMLDGRSSIGRLGISVHETAGFGDLGFKGTWTLEISCKKPVRIYPLMKIGQVWWTPPYLSRRELTHGGPFRTYEGKYLGQVKPTASRLHTERRG